MIVKKCFRCGETKTLVRFYKHPEMGDGFLGKCKECTKLDAAANRLKKLDRIRAYDRARGSRQSAEYRWRYRNTNPDKYKATNAVNNALRDGRLKKAAACEACGSTNKLHGHHEDYSKPLDVMWLCPVCHANAHRNQHKSPS